MRSSIPSVLLTGALALVSLVACSGPGGPSTSVVAGAPTTSGGQVPVPDFDELAAEMTPLVAPLGWEVQRAYRQPAVILRRDVDLVNVYLRPVGAEPSPAQYLADALVALRTVASHVFTSDQTVTAIDVCLQRPNDDAPDVEVEPAIRILGLREDLEPLVSSEVRLADLLGISQQGRLVLLLDDYVQQAPGWAEASATTTPG